jgi:membrane protein DedA with SNARE-associated domain
MPLVASVLSAEPVLDDTQDGVAGWAADFLDAYGAPGAGLIVALENVVMPLPSEILLPLGGFFASQGTMNPWALLFWAVLGQVVGSLGLYWAGASLGRDRLYAMWARMPLVNASDLERTEEWFARHGPKAVLIGRMLPLFRSLISVPAGVQRMPVPTFVAMTAIGGLLWNALLIFAGYWLGDRWDVIDAYVGVFSRVIGVAILLALGVFIVRRTYRSRSRSRAKRQGTP